MAKENLDSFLAKTKETGDDIDTLGDKISSLGTAAESMNTLATYASEAASGISYKNIV